MGRRTPSAPCLSMSWRHPSGIEVVVDLVGVHPDAVQVVVARDTLVVSGPQASQAACAHHGEAAFHVAERVFGRFARAVRLTGSASTSGAPKPRCAQASCASHCRGSRTGAAASIAFRYGPTDVRILFIGDIFGKPGREIAKRAIPALVERSTIDFVIANVENSAAGFGVTGDIADTILGFGVDVMTSGNHVWDKKEVLDYIPRQPKLLRPANFPSGAPGRGSYLGRTRTGEPVGVDQPDGTDLHDAARRSLRGGAAGDRGPPRRRRASSSSTSTPRRRQRRSRWAGTSTAG